MRQTISHFFDFCLFFFRISLTTAESIGQDVEVPVSFSINIFLGLTKKSFVEKCVFGRKFWSEHVYFVTLQQQKSKVKGQRSKV